MTKKEIYAFNKIELQLEALHSEITILSKKSPNDTINKFKLGFINKVLEESNTILAPDNKPFESFSIFDEVDLPTTSDVVMILTQYLSSFGEKRSKNSTGSYWKINGESSSISSRKSHYKFK